jgi:small subunit ribosomal protein S27Ae
MAADKKGTSKKAKNKKPSQRWKKYKIQGDKLTIDKHCPKCGPGNFLAIHKDRIHCGTCGYTEFSKK